MTDGTEREMEAHTIRPMTYAQGQHVWPWANHAVCVCVVVGLFTVLSLCYVLILTLIGVNLEKSRNEMMSYIVLVFFGRFFLRCNVAFKASQKLHLST